MIDVRCPMCGEVYHADLVHTGKRIKCRRCGSLVPILDVPGAIAQQTPGTGAVSQSIPRVEQQRAARLDRPRNARAIGFIVGVGVIAGGLALWWYSAHRDAGQDDRETWSRHAGKVTPGLAGTPAGSAEMHKELPATETDAQSCAEQASAKHRSMPNGSRIIPESTTKGYGVLKVENGTYEDAVLSFYDSAADEKIWEVYVQAKHSVRMTGIPEGTYQLRYAAGLDWDDDEATFRCDPDYSEFEREFTFTEKTNQKGVQYHSITVTLHPVVGGNIRTKRISREEFLKGNHRIAALPR